MAESFATPHPHGCIMAVHVTPGAKRSGITGMSQTPQGRPALKIAVRAKPTDGEANAAVLAFLATTLKLAPSAVTLLSGQTSRHKRVLVPLPAAQVAAALTA